MPSPSASSCALSYRSQPCRVSEIPHHPPVGMPSPSVSSGLAEDQIVSGVGDHEVGETVRGRKPRTAGHIGKCATSEAAVIKVKLAPFVIALPKPLIKLTDKAPQLSALLTLRKSYVTPERIRKPEGKERVGLQHQARVECQATR